MRRPIVIVAAAGIVSLSSGCATTIEDSGATTTVASASTTTTIPRGTVPELFAALLDIGKNLGNDVASGNTATARAKLADIRATWQAITPQIVDLGKDANEELQRLVNLYSSAVERKRPADADKATRFLTLAIEPIVGNG